jgi:hypothetical protein
MIEMLPMQEEFYTHQVEYLLVEMNNGQYAFGMSFPCSPPESDFFMIQLPFEDPYPCPIAAIKSWSVLPESDDTKRLKEEYHDRKRKSVEDFYRYPYGD